MPGRVVLFHGTSSSGKTTVARAVQRLSDEPWVHLGIDTFWNAIDERWMEHGPRAAEGFLWSEDATIVPGPVGQRLPGACVPPWRRSPAPVTTCSSMTSSSIPPGSSGGATSSSTSSRCLWASSHRRVLEERERAPGNRIAGEARVQIEVIHRGIEYDLTVDTSRQSPKKCAQSILAALRR